MEFMEILGEGRAAFGARPFGGGAEVAQVQVEDGASAQVLPVQDALGHDEGGLGDALTNYSASKLMVHDSYCLPLKCNTYP